MTFDLTSLPTVAAVGLLLPLTSALTPFLIGKRYSWIVPILSSTLLLGAAISGTSYALDNWSAPAAEYTMAWMTLGDSTLDFTIAIHPISLLLFALVTVISFLIHVYSIGYMVDDVASQRYFALLGFFTFAMLGLVVSGNLLQMFFFWELVGASSYFLIGHWRTKEKAVAAATKAFIMNRVGDAGFLVGLALLWSQTNTLNIAALSELSDAPSFHTMIGLCLLLGVIGKSAQFPLLTWLPDAMEGPTPVSALIHAATMVAAGVFLLVRIHFIFTPPALLVMAATGAITTLYGAWHALRQFDIKKILAYSTLSQLGLMVMAVGAGAWAESLLHLTTHAFFKACLFLGAGAIIHGLHQAQPTNFDPQDIRQMGGLRKQMPLVFIAFLLSGAALAGVPFTSGFTSKEAILGVLLQHAQQKAGFGWVWVGIFLLTTFLTTCYVFRLIFSVFFGEPRSASLARPVPRTPAIMVLPLAVLSLLCLWFIVASNPFHAQSWLVNRLTEPASVTTWIALLSAGWIFFALFISYFTRRTALSHGESETTRLDDLYRTFVVEPLVSVGRAADRTDRKWIDGALHGLAYAQVGIAFITAWVDRYVIDGVGRIGAKAAYGVGNVTRSLGGGNIQGYLGWAVFIFLIFLFWTLI